MVELILEAISIIFIIEKWVLVKNDALGLRWRWLIEDCYFYNACEYAKDDYFIFGIKRTQKEVECEAERLRKQALEEEIKKSWFYRNA